jgi:hypothetical protein
MVPAFIKNALFKRALKNLLDGNKGTNALNAMLTPVLLAQVDYALALRGFQFQDTRAVLELLKFVLIALNGLLLYFIGKYPALARWLKFAEDAVEAVEKGVEQTQKDPALK